MLLAPCSAKLSAQSPPWSRKASPLATLASLRLSARASPAKTSGGKVASCFSTSANAWASGYSGTCRIGLVRQLSGVQRLFTRPSRAFLDRQSGRFRDVFYSDRSCQKPVAPAHSAASRPSTLVSSEEHTSDLQ